MLTMTEASTGQPCRLGRPCARQTLWETGDLAPGECGRCCLEIKAQELQTEWRLAFQSDSLMHALHSSVPEFKRRRAEVAVVHSIASAISTPSVPLQLWFPSIGPGVSHGIDGFDVVLPLPSSPLASALALSRFFISQEEWTAIQESSERGVDAIMSLV